MQDEQGFDVQKRRSLKIVTSATAAGLLSVPAVKAFAAASDTGSDALDCRLICRADVPRAYLLMHNRSDASIMVQKFSQQRIQFDDTTVNLSDAFGETVQIPANDRVMVRLKLRSGLVDRSPIVDMHADTQYLPQGTRVVPLVIRLRGGIGSIDLRSFV